MGASALGEGRRGRNIRHHLGGLFRQSVFGRLAGYEDVNDAERLARDPTMRAIVGREGADRLGRLQQPDGALRDTLADGGGNLSALTDLSGAWIDRVHGRRPPRGIVLDMDSSVSPTHGEQELSAWNGHFECTCYHPLFVFNQFGDLERGALRPGNVHSADDWQNVLDPVVARYRGKVSRIYFRADAAFAMPGVYEYLEDQQITYAIRLPANRVLQERIGHLLKRPVGRPPNHVRRSHASFRYQAGSWTKPRRVIAKVEWHPGELVPRVGFIVTNMSRPAERVVGFYNQRGTGTMDKRGQGRDPMDAAVVPVVHRQCRPASAPCARLQSRQLPAHAGDARADQGLVADQPEGEADQDRREGGDPRPLCRLPDGRGCRAEDAVRRDPAADRRPAATVAAASGMSIASNDRGQAVGRGVSMSDRDEPKAAQEAGASLMRRVDAADGAGSSPRRLAESGGTADYRHSEAGHPGNSRLEQ